MGRNNAIMMGMARPFTHPEIKAIAAYLGSLPGDLKTVQQPRFQLGREALRRPRDRASRGRAGVSAADAQNAALGERRAIRRPWTRTRRTSP